MRVREGGLAPRVEPGDDGAIHPLSPMDDREVRLGVGEALEAHRALRGDDAVVPTEGDVRVEGVLEAWIPSAAQRAGHGRVGLHGVGEACHGQVAEDTHVESRASDVSWMEEVAQAHPDVAVWKS